MNAYFRRHSLEIKFLLSHTAYSAQMPSPHSNISDINHPIYPVGWGASDSLMSPEHRNGPATPTPQINPSAPRSRGSGEVL